MFAFPSSEPWHSNHGQLVSNFFSTLSSGISKLRRKPPLVYHYTGGDGLDGIVRKGLLRATHIAFMNDGSEYIHAVNRLLTQFELIRKRIPNQYTQQLADFIMGRLATTAPENYPPMFVCCFTNVEDSYVHWKSYGRQDGGFSIAFDREALEKQLVNTNGLLLPVVYDQDEQDQLISEVAAYILNEGPKQILEAPDPKAYAEVWITRVFAMATPYAAIVKAQNFTNENEWRVIFAAQSVDEVEFMPKPTLYTGYVNLPIAELPIHSIRVGPGLHQRLNVVSTSAMLHKIKKGHVYVRQSAHRQIE